MSVSLNNHESRIKSLENKTASGNGLGYGQKWYNVKSKRVNGTTYTNTTGSPIMVAIGTNRGKSLSLNITVDGVRIYDAANGSSSSGQLAMCSIVPPNSTYSCGGSIATWNELRSNNEYYSLLAMEVA